MSYKKVQLPNGETALDFNGIIIDEEMMTAMNLQGYEIDPILEILDCGYFECLYHHTGIGFPVASCVFLTVVAIFITFNSILVACLFIGFLAWIVGTYSFISLSSYTSIHLKYRNLINILKKIRSYNHIADKYKVISELKRHGVQISIPEDNKVEDKLHQLREVILRSLNADRILREYTQKWGKLDSSKYEALELHDLDNICARQVQEIEHVMNVETRLLNNGGSV
ncbi:MAG: hypothetical protein ACAI35_15245 [Candidatus Methylacidiphilales bacterium]|nr:hypothetical protein [Candidatus Methylacidiphilales bacterium]